MVKKVLLVPWRGYVGFFVLACSFVVAGCGEPVQAQKDSGGEPLPVTAQRIQAQRVPLMIETVGRTEGSKEVEVHARVSGILEKQVYSEGSHVKAGATLFLIDPVPFEIALAHAHASLAQEKAVHQQAQRTADRLSGLAAQNAVSQRQADDAISAVEAAHAAIQAARADVREAEVNLSYTRVQTPIAGIAGRAEHSEGSLVTPGADSSLLTTVTQTDPIWVRFALSVDEYEALRAAGAKNASALHVELLTASGEHRAPPGRINFAGSTVDTQVGTVQLRAEFSNPGLSILPGEYLRVLVSGGEMPGITVPQTSVLQGAEGSYVWVVNGKGQAEQRNVQTGAWIGDGWRIRTGLAAGDTLIVDNLLKLKPGQAVKVQPAARRTVNENPDREREQQQPATGAAHAGNG